MIYELENKLSSREVCEMMEIRHDVLLKKIDGVDKDFTDHKIVVSKYWTESSYKDGSGKSNREFQITKKGCEFLAHKTTGTKGNLFTDKYMDKFAAMENFINNPNGIIADLTKQIEKLNAQVQQLSDGLINSKDKKKKLTKKEKQLGISAPMSEKLSLIPDEEIMEIIKIAMENGLLRELDEGIAVDRRIMLEEAEKRNIAKSALNKKLLLMSVVIPNKDNHAYKQIREEGSARWCYVIRNIVNE